MEGPRPYRIWDLPEDGRFTKLKHLIEPRIAYVYTPEVNQDTLPQFDYLDRIPQANRLEYSITNTLFAKTRIVPAQVSASAATTDTVSGVGPLFSPFSTTDTVFGLSSPLFTPPTDTAPTGETVENASRGPLTTTQELLWIKLSQNYTFDYGTAIDTGQPFSALEWEARTRPLAGLEIDWRGNYDIYGSGIGYQNISLSWSFLDNASLRGEWRSTRGSDQDFIDLGGTVALGRIGLQARSRYNLAESTFVENRVDFKYTSQCWDVALNFVRWTTTYEYSITFSLKGIGTIIKI